MSGTNRSSPWDKPGPVPGTDRAPSLGQTGRFLFNSTVKSPVCPVCPWDGSRFVPGTIVLQGASEKCLCVLCLLFFFFFRPQVKTGRFLSFWLKSWGWGPSPLFQFSTSGRATTQWRFKPRFATLQLQYPVYSAIGARRQLELRY